MAIDSQVIRFHEQVREQFYNDLLDTVRVDCKQYFINKMIESIQEAVYDAYTPTLYKAKNGRIGGVN